MLKTNFVLTATAFGISLLLSVACAKIGIDSVDADTVHQTYMVTYDEATAKTTFNGFLEVGDGGIRGTRLDVTKSPKASLFANGQRLSPNYNTAYTLEVPAKVTNPEFVYTDKVGKIYTNKGTMPEIHLGVSTRTELLRSASTTSFRWDGAPLKQGEEISLYISGENGRSALVTVTQVGTTEVSVKTDDMRDLSDGPHPLYWKRTMRTPLQQATTQGGSFSCEYVSKKSSITVR